MDLRTGLVMRRVPEPEDIDRLFGAFFISFLIHIVFLTGLFIYSKIIPAIIKPLPKPKPYVVHLVDPGPLATAPQTRVKKTEKTTKTPPHTKSLLKPKKITPVKKDVSLKKSKMDLKQKSLEAQKKKVKAVDENIKKKKVGAIKGKKGDIAARTIQQRKTGGQIDIKKFPYEWYLRIMESKIYRNWDTLSVNFFSNRTLHVTVYFKVNRNGNLIEVKLEQSSLNSEIDESAMEAVRKSAPLPPLPPGYKEEVLEVHFGFKIDSES